MSDLVTQIGLNLRKHREMNKMTQKQFSEHIDMAESSYARIERGEKRISLVKLIESCKVLKITLNDVIPLDKIDISQENKEELYQDLCKLLKSCSAEQLHIISKLVETLSLYME